MKANTIPPEKKPRKKANEEDAADRSPDAPANASAQPDKDKDNSKTPSEAQADNGKPSEAEVISRWREPVTNQDEQEKITNAGSDDIPTPDK